MSGPRPYPVSWVAVDPKTHEQQSKALNALVALANGDFDNVQCLSARRLEKHKACPTEEPCPSCKVLSMVKKGLAVLDLYAREIENEEN